MTTRIWSFLPVDMHLVPTANQVATATAWLRAAMPAYKVEAIDHGKITFFDCGGNMGATYCPDCNAEISGKEWSGWMTLDYSDAAGFRFSPQTLPCCGSTVTLDRVIFENPCMFGRFGIAVTDTLKTYTDTEMDVLAAELSNHLGCPIRFLEAHY